MKLRLAEEAEKQARDRLAHEAWGARLSVDEYVAREQRLRRHVWARSAMATWLWLADDSAGSVLASCETYRMDGWRRGTRGDVWGVASVFTEAALRGRGYATAMIDRLLDEARGRGVIASILYSDVGERQYARSGFVARPATDLVFAPVAGAGEDDDDALLADTLITDAESLIHAAPLPADDAGLVVWPTVEQLDWHVERTRTYGALLERPALPWVGARAGDGQIRWMIDWKSECLKVTLLATTSADEAAALVRTAQRIAATFALREVRLWEQPWPFATDVFDALGGERQPRDGSIPMLAPLVPSLSASDWRDIPRAIWV